MQPEPIPNEHPATWDLVIDDMRGRDRTGVERYKTRLQPHNGRNSLQDAYEEQLDHCVYLKNELIEQELHDAQFVEQGETLGALKKECDILRDRRDLLLQFNTEEVEKRRKLEADLRVFEATLTFRQDEGRRMVSQIFDLERKLQAAREYAQMLKSESSEAQALRDLTPKQRLDFSTLQQEQSAWSIHNFGGGKVRDPNDAFLGVVEENGELADAIIAMLAVNSSIGSLAHAILKGKQGIRGNPEEHEAKAKDSVGDLLVFLADLCTRKGWSMQEIIEETWGEVKQRDWVKFPKNGKSE